MREIDHDYMDRLIYHDINKSEWNKWDAIKKFPLNILDVENPTEAMWSLAIALRPSLKRLKHDR